MKVYVVNSIKYWKTQTLTETETETQPIGPADCRQLVMQCKLKLVECSTVGEYQALLTIIWVLYNKCLGQTLIEITGTWGTYCSTAYCTHMLCCANGYVCHLHCKWLRLDIEDTSQRHASKQTILWGLSHHGPKRCLGNATISWPVVLCCAMLCLLTKFGIAVFEVLPQ